MRAAARFLPLAGLALAACSEAPQGAPADNAAATDIEALPADESVATSSEELANGIDEPAANELANAG